MRDLVECGIAVASGSTDSSLLLKYADALWNVRDTQAMIPVIDRALVADPPLSDFDRSKAYASRSICEVQCGNLERGLADVNKSLQTMWRAHPLGLRAIIERYLGNIEAAIADAQEAVQLDPNDWEILAWRGMILLEAGRLQEAIDDFTVVIDSEQCEKYASELYLSRARAQYMLGDPVAAEADCDLCIDLDYHEQAHWPFIVPSRSRMGHAMYVVRAEARLAQGRNHLALGDSFFAITLAPDDPVNYDLRARIYYAIGNLHEAAIDTIRAAHLRGLPQEDESKIGEHEAIRFAGAH